MAYWHCITVCQQLFGLAFFLLEKIKQCLFVLHETCRAWCCITVSHEAQTLFHVDMMNVLTFRRSTFCESMRSRHHHCPCMQTKPHRGCCACFFQLNPWISIWNRCSFFFLQCITPVNKLFSCSSWFQAILKLKCLIPHLRPLPHL